MCSLRCEHRPSRWRWPCRRHAGQPLVTTTPSSRRRRVSSKRGVRRATPRGRRSACISAGVGGRGVAHLAPDGSPDGHATAAQGRAVQDRQRRGIVRCIGRRIARHRCAARKFRLPGVLRERPRVVVPARRPRIRFQRGRRQRPRRRHLRSRRRGRDVDGHPIAIAVGSLPRQAEPKFQRFTFDRGTQSPADLCELRQPVRPVASSSRGRGVPSADARIPA